MDKPKRNDIHKLDYVLNNNAKEFNKVNDIVDNKHKSDSNYILSDIRIKYPQLIVTIRLIGGKNSSKILVSSPT